MKYINCGCGNRFSREKEWINIDFTPTDKDVIGHNILKGLPFEDSKIDVVFSSCMLEHFTKEEALLHVKECYRVLRPGGYIRIVVPDLEDVCREYLRVLDLVKKDEAYKSQYEYILIELIDQMARTQSGGEMAKYWNSRERNEEYIKERTGYPEKINGKIPMSTRIRNKIRGIENRLLGKFIWYRKYRTGRFIMSGEVHKWMYDEYSLKKLLEKVGFLEVERRKFNDSRIPGWAAYGIEGMTEEYKPHSLYIEGRK